jgi:hypothetical protein
MVIVRTTRFNAEKLPILPTQCIYASRMVLTANIINRLVFVA